MGRMILGEPKADKNMVLKLKKKKKNQIKRKNKRNLLKKFLKKV